MTSRKRAVGAIRLSRETEATTSPERQKQVIQAYADANGVDIIGWAIDLDVSAGIAPWDRPELGQWLNDRYDQYELLIFAKLDRAVRSVADFVDLDRWATKRSVSLVILDPPIDLSDVWGRALAGVLAVFAELERSIIGKRVKEGYEELLQQGRWPGGQVPYGYKKVRKEGMTGWYLETDPEQADVIRGIIDRIIAGASVLSQVKWLNDQGIKTRTGKARWQSKSLLNIVRSQSLMGYRQHKNGEIDRDAEGMPIQRAPGIITRAKWEQLQAALDKNSPGTSGARIGGAPLLRVAFCSCGQPFYRQTTKRTATKRYTYYRCRSFQGDMEPCGSAPFRAEELESVVFGEVMAAIGALEVESRVWVPGEDHTEALETAQAAYDELTQQLTITRSASGRKRLTEQLTALDARIAELEELPNRPGQWRYEGTGRTYAELWETLSEIERGAMLRDAGVKVMVRRLANDTPVAALALPKDLADRAKAWASAR